MASPVSPIVQNAIALTAKLPVLLNDRNALEKWVSDISPWLLKAATRYGNKLGLAPDLAQDILNETFVDLLATTTYPATNPQAWLLSKVMTAGNSVAQQHGRSRRNRHRAQDHPGEATEFSGNCVLKEEQTNDAAVAQVDAHDLLSALPEYEQAMLWQCYGLDRSQGEVAEDLGLTRPTLGRLVRRASVKARKLGEESSTRRMASMN